MERLWAPWRRAYVTGERPVGGCIFCAAPEQADEAASLVLARGENCFAILNAFPYNNGHLMVVPYGHTGELAALAPATLAEMMAAAARWTTVMAAVMGAEGFNVGFNLGAAAGAGLAEHVHLHVVPRWHGDTNLMPVVGGVKVLPEALETTRDRLRAAWREGQA
jgi:ATP adenylyltransferase